MKTITDDPKAFFETGGWTFLDPESETEGEGEGMDESEEDEAYEPTDLEDEDESDEDSEYSEASEDESDDDEDDDGKNLRFFLTNSYGMKEMCVIFPFKLFQIDVDLGSDEESGKDWSDLEREAAEDDANYSNKDDSFERKKKSSHSDRRDKHKSSKHHRYSLPHFYVFKI